MTLDVTYFRRRAVEERLAAERASDPRTKRVHELVADCYEAKVHSLSGRIEDAICTCICEREPSDPTSYGDILSVIMPENPRLTSMELEQILAGMIDSGKVEAFEDEERGTVYVRDC